MTYDEIAKLEAASKKQLRVVNIELRCGCGAQTFIEWPVETNYVNYLPDLVKGFHAAHAGCHGKASP